LDPLNNYVIIFQSKQERLYLKYKSFSIIVPTYNGAKRIKKTLLAIKHLSINKSYSYEIIIVNNNSTDNVEEVVNLLNIPNTRIVKEEKQGLLYARDRGIKESNFEIIFFIDDDVVVDKNWTDSFMEIMNEKEDAGLIGAKILFPENYHISSFIEKHKETFAVTSDLKASEYIVSGMFCFKKEVYDYLNKINYKQSLVGRGINNNKYNGGEDIEFSLMLRYTTYKCYDNNHTKAIHYVDKERLSSENLEKLKEASGYIIAKIAPYRYTYRFPFKYFSSYYYFYTRILIKKLISVEKYKKIELNKILETLRKEKKDFKKREHYLRSIKHEV